jgi:hypothetical protein
MARVVAVTLADQEEVHSYEFYFVAHVAVHFGFRI